MGGGAFDGSQSQQGSQPGGTAHVHAPASRRQQSALRAKALEGEGPFSNHCRSFDSQLKELTQQLSGVKERLGELHRDVTLLRRAHTPPLFARFDQVTRECAVLEEQLERHQVELERLKNVFDTLWEEQLCRIHVEQDIFQSQMTNILTLRSEVKHLSAIAHQLEPYVKSLSSSDRVMTQLSGERAAQVSEPGTQETSHQQLQSLLEHISLLQMDAAASYRMDGSQKGECRMHPGQAVTSPIESMLYVKDAKEPPVREGPRSRVSRDQVSALLDASGNIVYTSRQQQTQQQHSHQQQQQTIVTQSLQHVESGRDGKRGVLSQLIEKVRTKEDRKKSPVQEEARLIIGRERSKSDGRPSTSGSDVTRVKISSSQQSDDGKQATAVTGSKSSVFRSGKIDSSGSRYTSTRETSSKVASLYHTISGKVLGSRDVDRSETSSSGIDVTTQVSASSHSHHHIPPPPPPSIIRRPQSHHENLASTAELISSAGCMDVRERLENHLKEKLHDMMARSALAGRVIRPTPAAEKGDESGMDESEYQRISEATTSPVGDGSAGAPTKQAVRAMVHHDPNTVASTPTSPHRHRDQSGKVVRLYPASDTEDSVFYANNERPTESEKTRKQNNSCESLTLSSVSVNSRRSSVDLGDRKTLVFVIGSGSKGAKSKLMQKQRSWETFPPKKRGTTEDHRDTYGKFCRDPESFRGGFDVHTKSDGEGAEETAGICSETGTLKKADSFEGHEEAVRTLVAAVQETRSQHLQQQRKQSHSKAGPS
ncbi:uncharacterized protein LOC134528993 [Bacillus rossius redtenbacheri]|uniref:uncharacterized protein LOC134528993 n=1 Tax=Bacillus rossius redtenbacheri TaxID=93214 RepID=UPI002FDE46AA